MDRKAGLTVGSTILIFDADTPVGSDGTPSGETAVIQQVVDAGDLNGDGSSDYRLILDRDLTGTYKSGYPWSAGKRGAAVAKPSAGYYNVDISLLTPKAWGVEPNGSDGGCFIEYKVTLQRNVPYKPWFVPFPGLGYDDYPDLEPFYSMWCTHTPSKAPPGVDPVVFTSNYFWVCAARYWSKEAHQNQQPDGRSGSTWGPQSDPDPNRRKTNFCYIFVQNISQEFSDPNDPNAWWNAVGDITAHELSHLVVDRPDPPWVFLLGHCKEDEWGSLDKCLMNQLRNRKNLNCELGIKAISQIGPNDRKEEFNCLYRSRDHEDHF